MYKEYSDHQLLDVIKEDGQQAIAEIYDRYWDKLILVAANLLDNDEDAEECVQNVFMSLWRRRVELKLKYSLATYLAVSVKYQSLSVMSKRHRERTKSLDLLPQLMEDYADSPESDYIAKELQQQIERSINNLPPQCRLVFQLRREQNKNVKDIAAEMGISENTVKMHLKSANKKLRNDLLAFIPVLLTSLLAK